MSPPVVSMTGFGRAEHRFEGACLYVEMRSVNQRFLKVQARLPQELASLEDAVRRLVATRIGRGQVDVSARLDGDVAGAAGRYRLNGEALERHIADWKRTAAALKLQRRLPLEALLFAPDTWVEEPPQEEQKQLLADALVTTAEQALAELCRMKQAEGAATANDLRRLLAEAAAILVAVKQLLPQVRQRLFAAAADKVRALLAAAGADGSASESLRSELALLADRSDINEELARLDSHVAQFRQILEAGGMVGRRLEFLLQEMHRELNTIAAKSQDAQVAGMVVECKVLTERAREQVQNLE